MTRAPSGPLLAVSDGAHEGNPDFFFLPPLFGNPSTSPDFEPAAFNPDLRPTVDICELGGIQGDPDRSCATVVRRFEGSEVSVSTTDQHYQVNWNTDESSLSVTKEYRIRVLVGTTELGFADVDPVSSGKDLRNVQTGEYIGLVDGRTLPIKFRIEDGALCGEDGTPCAAATINLDQGGGITLEAAGEIFRFDIPAGTEATSNGQPVTNVTFNLEACDGIDVDLPTFGACLRVTTFFDVTGEASELVLTNAALISLCVLQPNGATEEQERLITLHQQDGNLIQALPHADPNCEVIGSRATGLPGLAGRGWSWLRSTVGNLVTPRTLYAGSRTAVFDLGGGGETNRFGSSCESAGSARQSSPRGLFLVECPPSVAPQLAATAGPAEARTVSDFQFALPSQINFENGPDLGDQTPGAEVTATVKITDVLGTPVADATVRFNHIPPSEGNGGVASPSERCTTGDSDDLVCTTDASGIIEVRWTLSETEGRNLLSAGGRGMGIHADQDGNGPFDSCLPVESEGGLIRCTGTEPVFLILSRGVITFFADGVPPMGSLQFIQQPTNTITGEAISPALQIRLLDPSGAPVPEFVRVTVGNAPDNPETCQVLQVSTNAIEGVATLDNVIVNGTCTGARVAVRAGGIVDYEFPIIVSEPFDILPEPAIGLLLRYQFDGNVDNTGLLPGYTGTATSVTYPDGKFGQAIKFDASDATGAILTGTRAVFATGSQWTISVWFKEDDPAKAQSLLWEFRATEGLDSYHGVALSGGDQVITTCSDGGCFSFLNPTLGQWHNIIYRYDGPSTTVGAPVSIFVDGVLAGVITNASAETLIGSSVKDIRLGSGGAGSVAGPSRFYVDEFRVYNQVFTLAEQCTTVIGGTWTGESCTMP